MAELSWTHLGKCTHRRRLCPASRRADSADLQLGAGTRGIFENGSTPIFCVEAERTSFSAQAAAASAEAAATVVAPGLAEGPRPSERPTSSHLRELMLGNKEVHFELVEEGQLLNVWYEFTGSLCLTPLQMACDKVFAEKEDPEK